MDTHPRAEDESLPQHEALAQQPEDVPGAVAESIEQDLVAAEKVLVGDSIAEGSSSDVTILADDSDPVAEGTDEIELSAEDLLEDAISEAVEAPVAASAEPPVTEEPAVAAVTIPAPSIAADCVSESEFAHMVDDALEAVGGILLFKMRLDEAGEDKHVAAASIGDGARRQFLLLSLPATGGKLKVESASRSTSPLAKLAEAYVGVVEAFRAAA